MVSSRWDFIAMKEYIHFVLFDGDESNVSGAASCVPGSVFQEMLLRWPECKRPGKIGFYADFEKDSPTLHSILKFLDLQGKHANWQKYPSVPQNDGKRFQLRGRREFDELDVDSASYLVCYPKATIAALGSHLPDGTLTVPRREIRKQLIGAIMSGGASMPVCTESLRREIDVEDFQFITYRPVKIEGKFLQCDSLWELWSELALPPILNRLVDDIGIDYDVEKNGGCAVDDLYTPWLFRYSRDAVESRGHFDLAITKEYFHFGPPHIRDPYLVVSQRFRKWCDGKKLKIDWWPVVLE